MSLICFSGYFPRGQLQTLLPNGSFPPGDSLEDGAKYDFAGRVDVEEFETLVGGSSFTKVQKDICSNSVSNGFWEEFRQRGFLAVGIEKTSSHVKKNKACPKAELVDSWRASLMLFALMGLVFVLASKIVIEHKRTIQSSCKKQ